MKIELKKLIPEPLVEIPHDNSEIWESDPVIFSKGKFVSIVAGSGKGKTSLLSSIYGIRKDYRGQILIDGKDSSEFSEKTWSVYRKNHLSYIFQGLELFDELSALENIKIKNRISGFKSEEEIRLMAEQIGILPYLSRKVGILSFGQKQRVAIIRALCQKMDILLADEIFSHLDKESSAIVFSLIKSELEKQNAGLLMTSLDVLENISFHQFLKL